MKAWRELQRREVPKLAVIYVVSAWVLVQVAELLLEAWGYPDESVRFAVIAAVLGFPIALVFGWFFDVREGRLLRTTNASIDAPQATALRAHDYAMLGVLCVFAAAIVSWAGIRTGLPPVTDIQAAFESIVILPFESENASDEEDRLGAGFAEALRTTLSRQDRFTVIAGRSIAELISSDFSPREIQRELGAAYVISGSVDASTDELGISALLFDGSHRKVLDEFYSRSSNDILRLQQTIAEAFATAVSITLPGEDQGETIRTIDPVAFQYSQLGRQYFHTRVQGWHPRAKEAYQLAIEADPDYAAPYAGLALIDSVNRIGVLPDEEVAEIKKLIDKSLALDPNLGMGHAAYGFWAWSRDGPLAAIPHFRKAIELDPMLMNAYPWLAITLGDVGEFEASFDVLSRAIAKDPLNPILANAYSQHQSFAGNFEQAEAALLRIASLPEPWPPVMTSLQMLYNQYGHQDKAVEYAKNFIRLTGDLSEGSFYGHLCFEYARAGMFEEAEYWFERQFPDGVATINGFANRAFIDKAKGDFAAAAAATREFRERASPQDLDPNGVGLLLVGYFLAMNGELDEAMQIYEPMIPDAREEINFIGFDVVGAELFGTLMWTLLQVGHDERASYLIGETVRGHDYLVASGQAGNPHFMEKAALLFTLKGDLEEALKWLDEAVDAGWREYYVVRHDPRWQELLQLPEAQALMSEAKADLERQAARIREADRSDGFLEYANRLQTGNP